MRSTKCVCSLIAHNLLLRLVSIIPTAFVQHAVRNVTAAYPSPRTCSAGEGQVAPHRAPSPHLQPPFAVTRQKSLLRRLSRRHEGGD